MSTVIEVRDILDETYRKLEALAARAGLSPSDYVARELRRWLSRPTRAEVLERLKHREPTRLDPSPSQILASVRSNR